MYPTRTSPCNDSQLAEKYIQNQSNKKDILAFPVPTSEILNIENLYPGTVIYLYDVLGNIVLKELSEGESVQLNIRTLPAGVYFVKVKNSDAVRIVKLF